MKTVIYRKEYISGDIVFFNFYIDLVDLRWVIYSVHETRNRAIFVYVAVFQTSGFRVFTKRA